jgi:hypothetical protein
VSTAPTAPNQGRAGFAGRRGRVAVALASWLIPGIMVGAYIVLMFTSDVDATGAAWESIGLGFVLILWWLFRLLTEHAAMARAVSIGDAARVAELAEHQLRKNRSARSRAPYAVYRALAFELVDDWQSALAVLAEAKPEGTWQRVAASVRVSALVELGRTTEARKVFDRDMRGPRVRDAQLDVLAVVAEARLRKAEGDRAGAEQLLARVARDVRAGSGTRARAQQQLDRLGEPEAGRAAAT